MNWSTPQFSFNAGEFSPRAIARSDLDRYANGASEINNFLLQRYGGVYRRPGTKYSGISVPENAKLIPIQVSEDEGAIGLLEEHEGGSRIRVFNADTDTGSAVLTLTTPYTPGEIKDVRWVSINRLLLLLHPGRRPRLVSGGLSSLSIGVFSALEGPLNEENIEESNLLKVTLEGSTLKGEFTKTGGDAVVADGDIVAWVADDFRWWWGTVSSYTLATHVFTINNAKLMGDPFYEPGADEPALSRVTSANWADGQIRWKRSAWGGGNGYPGVGGFWQNRLWLGSTSSEGDNQMVVWASRTGKYNIFNPHDWEGKVMDDSGMALRIVNHKADRLCWMRGTTRAIILGYEGREVMIQARDFQTASLTSSIHVSTLTNYGSEYLEPIESDYSITFPSQSGRIVDLVYDYRQQQETGGDLAMMSEHFFRSGVKSIAQQREPHTIIWIANNENRLISGTVERDINIVGWSGHGPFECFDVQVARLGREDFVWLILDHGPGKTLERLTRPEDGVYVDSAIVVDGDQQNVIQLNPAHAGKEFTVSTDGRHHIPVEVASDGKVFLEYPADRVIMGYPYLSKLVTLPVWPPANQDLRGVKAVAWRAWAYVLDSMPAKIGHWKSQMDWMNWQGMDTHELYTGSFEQRIESGWGLDHRIVVEQSRALPLNLLTASYWAEWKP